MPALLLVAPGVLLVGLFLLAWTQTHHAVVKSHTESGGYLATLRAWFSFGGNPVARLFVAVANFAVSRFAHTYVVHVTRFFTGVNLLIRSSSKAQADAAVETASAVERMRGVVIPREVNRKVAPVRATAKAAHREAAKADQRANSVGTALDHYKARTNPQIRHATHAVDVTLPHDIADLRARNKALERARAKDAGAIQDLEHGATKTWEWIRSHPLGFATTAFAGAVAVALGRMGLGGLRCKNFTNLLRNYGCGLGTLLARLLPLAVLLTLAFDFQDFCKAANIVATGIGDAVAGIEGQFNVSLPPLPPPNSV